jgi:competence protein ComEA
MRLSFCGLFLASAAAFGQQMPDGPGKAETEKMCKGCHEIARSISPRQDRVGWSQTLAKMTAFGMKSTEADYELVLNYLSKSFPAEDVQKVNVNTAQGIELESGLTLLRSQAKAIIDWREKNGPFKSLDDLKKIPGISPEKWDGKKDRISFQ